MLFSVTHKTIYTFSAPAFIEPHTIRLRPRSDSWQQLLEYTLEIHPQPAGLSEFNDTFGNSTAHAWFDQLADRLLITTRFQLVTQRENPFDYLLPSESQVLPMYYPDNLLRELLPFRADEMPEATVLQYANSLAYESGNLAAPFLTRLCSDLYARTQVVIRETGDPLPPEECLASREGSCRDLAVLFMECCRAVGLAARFVSGYQCGDPDQECHYMHAWAEIYLHEAGWRGYDPTHGLAVSNQHVAVAAAAASQGAAPIIGNYRGTGVTSTMEAEIKIETRLTTVTPTAAIC